MSSPQPPAGGDRPTEAEPGAAAEHAPAPDQAAPATRPAAAKRAPSPRKRTPKTEPISPNGEAPEILDAMLGKAVTEDTVEATTPAKPRRRPATSRSKAAAAPDTSTSPAEPVVAADAAEPHEGEAATAVLPTADDFYRVPTAETEILKPAEANEEAEVETEILPASPAAEPVPVGAVSEDTTADASAGATTAAAAAHANGAHAGEDAPPPPAAGPHAPRPGRTMNDLADRLDDSRFFSSLFDFTFTSYVTRKLAGPVYVVGLVLIGLGIVVGFANSLGIAIATRSPGGGAFVFLLGVLVTLVAAILSVLLLRVTIEVFCAIIEIAQNTRRRRPPRD
ncbi:DUF4282 domain-containing protein [Leifsonia sp. NPDC056665]|uniref:DUF4282 domain-containing protein n=1 Tax=Leifsonia sp. NPDC056665 TaxID=3345901 RepID=UPI00367B5DC4